MPYGVNISRVHLILKESIWVITINLTHWDRLTHIRVCKLTIIGSDNGLSPGRRCCNIVNSRSRNRLQWNLNLKMSSVKWRPFCLGLHMLNGHTAERDVEGMRQFYHGMLVHNVMITSWNGNIFRVTGPLCGEFTGPGEFPTQRPVTRSFDVFFDLCPNKRLSKQPWGWWFGGHYGISVM